MIGRKYLGLLALFVLFPLFVKGMDPAEIEKAISAGIETFFANRFPIPIREADLRYTQELKDLAAAAQAQYPDDESKAIAEAMAGILKKGVPSDVLDAVGDLALGEERHGKMKWYNTALTPDKNFWGIYKGDLLEIARTAGDLAVDTYVRKILLRKRTDAIFASVKEDYAELLKILEVVEGGVNGWDTIFSAVVKHGLMAQFAFIRNNSRTRAAHANPLINYIKDKHKYFGMVPITMETFLPLLARWSWTKASGALENKYATTVANDGIIRAPIAKFANMFTYKDNDEGKPVLARAIFPLSPVRWIMRGIRLANDPFRYFRWEWPLHDRRGLRIAAATSMLPVPIPGALLSDTAFHVYDFIGVCFGAKIFDEIYTVRWTKYAIEHRTELRALLKAYERAVSSGVQKEEAEAALKRFIDDGHRDKGKFPGTMLNGWWQAIKAGHSTLPAWVGLAITGTLLARAALAFIGK